MDLSGFLMRMVLIGTFAMVLILVLTVIFVVHLDIILLLARFEAAVHGIDEDQETADNNGCGKV